MIAVYNTRGWCSTVPAMANGSMAVCPSHEAFSSLPCAESHSQSISQASSCLATRLVPWKNLWNPMDTYVASQVNTRAQVCCYFFIGTPAIQKNCQLGGCGCNVIIYNI